MEFKPRVPQSHGDGSFSVSEFGRIGANVVLEGGVLAFHPENIELGDRVYVGHRTILKGYFRNRLVVGDDSWIGQSCFIHSAGGVTIGKAVGIGPNVTIITSVHEDDNPRVPVLHNALKFAPVSVGDGADLGVGCIILPGVSIGSGAIVGAGSVVSRDIPAFAVAAGVPCRVLRVRPE